MRATLKRLRIVLAGVVMLAGMIATSVPAQAAYVVELDFICKVYLNGPVWAVGINEPGRANRVGQINCGKNFHTPNPNDKKPLKDGTQAVGPVTKNDLEKSYNLCLASVETVGKGKSALTPATSQNCNISTKKKAGDGISVGPHPSPAMLGPYCGHSGGAVSFQVQVWVDGRMKEFALSGNYRNDGANASASGNAVEKSKTPNQTGTWAANFEVRPKAEKGHSCVNAATGASTFVIEGTAVAVLT